MINLEKNTLFVVGVLKATDEKSRIRIRSLGNRGSGSSSGSVPKCNDSQTQVFDPTQVSVSVLYVIIIIINANPLYGYEVK
jgi:hypothetical protein